MNRSLLMTVLVVVLVCLPALSQQGRWREGRPMERIDRLKKVRLIEFLELQEEESARFIARLNEHEKSRRDLQKEKGDALDRLEQLLEKKADVQDLQKGIGEVEAINAKVGEENRKFFSGLSDILSVEQRAKMLLFERRFEKELREAIRDVQRRRPEPGTE